MSRFTGQNVAVVGVSVEGVDTITFLLNEGAHVIALDRKSPDTLQKEIDNFKRLGCECHFGSDYLDYLDTVDIIVRTPGMSPRTPELLDAQKKGKEITGATEIFFELCQAPIIGVTGTKGKGTTSTLIYEILTKAGHHAYLGGNVGTPLLAKVRSMIAENVIVLELSSFQLETLRKSPHIAVVLRITQDHLANFDRNATNFHETRASYVDAKSSIVRFQSKEDVAIVNMDDPTSLSFAAFTKARVLKVARQGKHADCFVRNHAVFLAENGQEIEICNATTIKVRGDHNLENIAAATLATRAYGVTIKDIQVAVSHFKGLEHRIELVKTIHGVTYYNDSFSTVPETTIAAIDSFEEPKILILGGSEKKSDFTEMGKKIATSNVEGVVVIGQMTDRIVEALRVGGFKKPVVTGCVSMHDIVRKTRDMAAPGSVVILTPACASFDMFSNYKERGRLFKDEVLSLA